MTLPLSEFSADSAPTALSDAARDSEWLETDGKGGFASSTVSLCPIRRYHALLVAPPKGTTTRHVFLSALLDRVTTAEGSSELTRLRFGEDDVPAMPDGLTAFSLVPWPRSTFLHGPYTIRRELLLLQDSPTVLVRYEVSRETPAAEDETDEGVALTLRPLVAFREADALTVRNEVLDTQVDAVPGGIRMRPYRGLPAMTVTLDDGDERDFTVDPAWYIGVRYQAELDRGHAGHEDLFSPGWFGARLRPGESVTLAASIDETLDAPAALFDAEAEIRRASLPPGGDMTARLTVAADDFLYETDDGRAGVIAGFPWFTEWGRDTFVALPGLTLARGWIEDCEAVLDGALPFVKDGLLPTLYGPDADQSLYGSIDPSLWFARAVLLHDRAGGDRKKLDEVYRPVLESIAEEFIAGTAPGLTALGVRVDKGLMLGAGVPGVAPTWMDAKLDGEPVTPRHGQAVEVCALWVSLLSHLAELEAKKNGRFARLAKKARRSFTRRFWLEDEGILADVVTEDGVDATVRPNMVIAASLELSPLSKSRRKSILERAARDLLTPRGLRSLAQDDRAYAPQYRGDVAARDRAYHQGTAWPWLLGPYTEASLRVSRRKSDREALRALWTTLGEDLDAGGLGHIAEVYDGSEPQHRGGAFAQAWNVGEALRALALIDGRLPLSAKQA